MPVIDEYDKLVLNFEGADGSTTFTDSCTTPKTVTANGTAQIDTAQYKFGGSCGLFDGDSDYLTTPDSDDWFFDTADFTIDCFIRLNSLATPCGIYYQGTSDADRLQLIVNSSTTISFYSITGSVERASYSFAASLTTATWYHLAIVRNGSALYCFLDGVSLTPTVTTAIATNAMPNFSVSPRVGYARLGATDRFFNGWIDSFRIRKGHARWTSNFTIPDEPYYRGIPAAYDSGRRNRINTKGVSSYNQLA